ncbi:hypothetical protein Tco_0110091 [Tanacetum coccineum]
MGGRSTLYCQGEELVLLVLPVVCLYCQWQLILLALSLKVSAAAYLLLLALNQEQTALGKEFSNPLIADSLLKTIWFSTHHASQFYYEELAIPGQTATGKESSNSFMAGSLPKTIHFCDSLQSDDDSFELIELMILCTNFLTMGRIDYADAEVTFIDEASNDARNKNKQNFKQQLEVKKCLDTSS